MENKIKQRIVGALVLIGLVAVMLSILFHNENSPDKNLATNSQLATNPKVEIIFSDQAQKVALKHQELTHTQQQFESKSLPQTQIPPIAQSQIQPQKIIPPQNNVQTKPITSVSSKHNDVAKMAASQQTEHSDVWAIQMGSFRDKVLALRLENKLKEQGYKTYIHKISGHKGITYNVRVGPINQKQAAKKLQHRLATVVKLKGFLMNEKTVKNELA